MNNISSWADPAANSKPLFILGPCAIEGRQFILETAEEVKKISESLDINVIFKSSFDKANRTSGSSKRGVGIEKGLDILNEAREKTALPIITDIHTEAQARQAGEVVDAIQIPAFLCRQTDIIVAAAKTGKVVNIKKGQFLAPTDMKNVQQKALDAGSTKENIWLCERGTTFGYGNLVVDMRGIEIMRQTGSAVIFDATHSVQLPGAGNGQSSGQREFVPALGRAALAVGAAGIFAETHPDPANALSDGPNMWPLGDLERLLRHWLEVSATANSARATYSF